MPIGLHRDEEVDGFDTVCFLRRILGFVVPLPVEMTSLGSCQRWQVPPVRHSVAVMRRGFVALDDWDLEEVFSRRGSLMRSVSRFLWGSFDWQPSWHWMRLCRGTLLHKLARGTIPKAKLVARYDKFAAGQWNDLINEGVQCAEDAATLFRRQRRRDAQIVRERRARSFAMCPNGW